MDSTSSLASLIRSLTSANRSGQAALVEIYRRGRALADPVVKSWLTDAEMASLLGTDPRATVGLAVHDETSTAIFSAWGPPCFADVPPDQDALEFEINFGDAHLDILTSTEPAGSGAIARYLRKFGEGIQQVEYRCKDVDRATAILNEKFEIAPVYPTTRPGADGTRINFFLVPSTGPGKVLIELYETPPSKPSA